MVIICPECTTKFKINPDRIPAGGTKVRCARCKTVFTVAKETQETAPIEQTKAEQLVKEEQEETPSAATEFSYERFQELDTPQENEEFSFSDAHSPSAEELSPATDTPEEDFSFEEPAPQGIGTETRSPLPAENNANAPVTPQKNTEDVFNKTQTAHLDQEEKEAEQLYQQLAEKKSSPVSSIIRILLLLVLAILVAVGVFVYINGPDKLNDTIQQLLGQQTVTPEPSGQITLANLQGKFLSNEHVGEVFLIRGEAINNFSQARSSIQVKGIIFDQAGQPLLQKTVFCGNPIADAEIAERPFEDLEKMMGNQFGKNLSNMKVNAKQTIPFDIVFKDLPKNLSEFSVNVTASKPASE